MIEVELDPFHINPSELVETEITVGQLRALRRMAAFLRLFDTSAFEPSTLSAFDWIERQVEKVCYAKTQVKEVSASRFVCRVEDPMGSSVAVADSPEAAQRIAIERFEQDLGRPPHSSAGITVTQL